MNFKTEEEWLNFWNETLVNPWDASKFSKKKYALTTKVNNLKRQGTNLFQIIAVKDFGDIKKGERGGWVESEMNLSQEGNCWILDDALAHEKSNVSGNAILKNLSEIKGTAKITGNVKLYKTYKLSKGFYSGNQEFGKANYIKKVKKK